MNLSKKAKEEATEVIAHDVEPITVDTDEKGYSRLGWLVVILGVGGFLLWALFAPLDKGVPMSGTVSKEMNRQAVQYQPGGVVQEILVKDGDAVKAGQVLVRMNNVQVKAQADGSRGQYYSALAIESRLLAERDGAKSIAFPDELLKHKADPRVAEVMESQRQLFSSRQASLQSELSAMEQNISGLKMQATGLEESRKSKKEQLVYIKEQLDNTRDLAKEGYVARSRVLELERMFSQINGAISEDTGNLGRTRQQVLEITLRATQRRQDYQKEVRSQLSDVQREAETLSQRLTAQDFELASVDVKSPVDGTVVGLQIFTRGGVVPPGYRLMDVVPEHDPLVVEGQLPVNLIDRVHNGLPVELIFSAFNANKTPHIPGVVSQVSADRTVDEKTGVPYYKVRARVTPEGARLIAQKKLVVQPGMPVELFVKTGERTMMSYLLKPIFDRAKTSMSEE
jgi:membrane fusion protein, protease secretion system